MFTESRYRDPAEAAAVGSGLIFPQEIWREPDFCHIPGTSDIRNVKPHLALSLSYPIPNF